MYHRISGDSKPCSKGQREKKGISTDNYSVFHRLRVLVTSGSGQSPTTRKESDLRKTLTDFFFMLVKRKPEEEKGTS